MPDNRKYYYLKLKENYFEDDAIVLLESMPDGILYSNILLKLYLKSLKNGGKLEFAENIPYTSQMIATITRHQVGTVEKALQVFLQLGLVEPMENGALYMSNIELMIGQSSTEAERKRRARLALNQKKCLPDASADKCPPYTPDKCPDICPPERELDIDIEKEIKVKKRESEREKRTPAPAACGKYGNVCLTEDELAELKAELPDQWEYYVDRLSCHIASTGKSYKSHAATIYKWAQEDAAKNRPGKKKPDYSYSDGDSL
ncbi:MAG: phage replisome organizer N-terminal domain-containing protein [Lachnospiraceae bacterium]|nr:phage replisome organizer N-terminal domain-containing protein [Lachnospiraceae bacterium]